VASQERRQEEDDESGAREFLRLQGEMFEAGFSFSGFERDMVSLNRGDGRYLNISGVSGADSVTDGRGSVYADFDNDGDLDLFLRAMHGPAHLLFRNEVGQDSGSVRVALEGRASGRDAFGAVVRMKTSHGIQTKTKSGGSGFLSQGDPRLLFGLGNDAGVEWVKVTWPSGLEQTFPGVESGTSLKLVEGEPEAEIVREHRFELPDPVPAGERLWEMVKLDPGDRLPALPVIALDGSATSLDALKAEGRPVLVNFWATWCVPCAREMPELQRLFAESGLGVVGVSLDRPEDRARIPAFLERLGVTYPAYTLETHEQERLFASEAIPIPLSILVDGDGRARELFSGWSREARRRLEKYARDE